MFRGKPWMLIVVIVLVMLALSIGFLVIAMNNPPVPHEPARIESPDDDFTEAQMTDDVPRGQAA